MKSTTQQWTRKVCWLEIKTCFERWGVARAPMNAKHPGVVGRMLLWEWSRRKSLGTVRGQYFHVTVGSAKCLREVGVLESEPESTSSTESWSPFPCTESHWKQRTSVLRRTVQLCAASQFLSLGQDTQDEKPNREKGSFLIHLYRFQSKISWLCRFGLDRRQGVMEVGVCGRGDTYPHGSQGANRQRRDWKKTYPSIAQL